MEVKILGISGSYRKQSGTSVAVKRALEGAQSIHVPVKTEFIALQGKNIGPCVHCDGCYRRRSTCIIQDDFQEVQEAFLEADGYILGSPVYEMNYTPVMGALLSRIRPVYLEYPGHFTRRAGAAIAAGGNRNGGQEMVLINIQNFFNTNEIITSGGTFHDPGGACLVTVDGSYEKALEDRQGLNASYRVGQRLAQTAALLKYGAESFASQGISLIETKDWYDVEG